MEDISMSGTKEGGKKSAITRGHHSLSEAGKKGAKARSHESRVLGGIKAAKTRGHESLRQAGQKGAAVRLQHTKLTNPDIDEPDDYGRF